MKILRPRNFRCFEDFNVEFTPGVNLIVGDNAGGKTSLLRAAKYAASAFFCGFTDINTEWESPCTEDFKKHIVGGWEHPLEPVEIEFALQPELLDKPLDESDVLLVKKLPGKKSRGQISGLVALRDYGRDLLSTMYEASNGGKKRMRPLPLLDSVSTYFTHTGKKIPKQKFLSLSPRCTLGYLGALTGGGFGAHWWTRIKLLAETNERCWELDGVRSAVSAALGADGCGIIENIKPVVSLNDVYIMYTTGETVTYDMLPDGYLRLLDMVVNVAFRALLLNGELYGADAPRLTHGLMLIDEIDLHLHPSLQARVLKGLCNAFPNIQFIATTHAPMVMSGVENNMRDQVLLLRNKNNNVIELHRLPTYGMDVNSILHLLNLRSRDAAVDEKVVKLFDLIDEGRNDEAHRMIEDLKSKLGDVFPDIVEAESLLELNSFDDAGCK